MLPVTHASTSFMSHVTHKPCHPPALSSIIPVTHDPCHPSSMSPMYFVIYSLSFMTPVIHFFCCPCVLSPILPVTHSPCHPYSVTPSPCHPCAHSPILPVTTSIISNTAHPGSHLASEPICHTSVEFGSSSIFNTYTVVQRVPLRHLHNVVPHHRTWWCMLCHQFN